MYIRVQSRAFRELHAVLPQSAPDTVFISLQLSDTEIVIALGSYYYHHPYCPSFTAKETETQRDKIILPR